MIPEKMFHSLLALGESWHISVFEQLPKPNGIVSFSPRLPRFSGATLGPLGKRNNANGVVAGVLGAGKGTAATALRWVMFVGRLPKVAHPSQSWALKRNSVGIRGRCVWPCTKIGMCLARVSLFRSHQHRSGRRFFNKKAPRGCRSALHMIFPMPTDCSFGL
jgi:hypothetical protein